MRRRWLSHLIVLVAMLGAVGCSVASQYAVKHLVDVLGTHDPAARVLWGAVGLLLGLVAGDNMLWRLAGWVSTHAFVAVGGDMRLELFDHLSGQGTRYFVERFPGALAGRITAAANASWTIENSMTWTTIPPGIAVILSIFVLGTINWHLTAVLIVIVSALGAVIGWLASQGKELHQNFAGHAAHVSGDLTDVVTNISLVRAFGAARREQERLTVKIGDEMQAQRASLRSLERLRLFHAFTVFAVTAGVLIWSVELWRRGEISTGDVVLTTTLGFTVLHASRDFAMALVDMVQQFAKLGEAVQVLGLPHEMPDAPDAKPLVVEGGAVSFRNVNFSYPSGQSVLNNFVLDVPAGQKIGLGRPLRRRQVDDHRAAAATLRSARRSAAHRWAGHRAGHAGKSAQLHRGGAAGHLAVPPLVARESALRASGCERRRRVSARWRRRSAPEFIKQMPEGFDTLVGERGMKLSGGQRQRLAIARAFLMDAPIVLLDEATSALDTESEQAIQEALARLFKGRTVIAIAHRLSTLDAFDRIVVLDRGRIVEDGPPRRLLQSKGVYSKMYGRQVRVSAEQMP